MQQRAFLFAGDWQFGGTAIPPDAVFGTWKADVRALDKTATPNVITVTPDADPAMNNWNLGPGSDPVPTPTPTNQGYGAQCRWNISSLNLIPGHQYHFYFIVHDGDQRHTGGDVGQACVFLRCRRLPNAKPNPDCVSYTNAYANRDTGDDHRRYQDVRRQCRWEDGHGQLL